MSWGHVLCSVVWRAQQQTAGQTRGYRSRRPPNQRRSIDSLLIQSSPVILLRAHPAAHAWAAFCAGLGLGAIQKARVVAVGGVNQSRKWAKKHVGWLSNQGAVSKPVQTRPIKSLPNSNRRPTDRNTPPSTHPEEWVGPRVTWALSALLGRRGVRSSQRVGDRRAPVRSRPAILSEDGRSRANGFGHVDAATPIRRLGVQGKEFGAGLKTSWDGT